MQELMLAFVAVIGLSAAGFALVAFLWLRKVRETLSHALTDSAVLHARTAQRFAEGIAQIQKQQHRYEQQLNILAQANAQLRQGLVNVASQIQHGPVDGARVEPTIH